MPVISQGAVKQFAEFPAGYVYNLSFEIAAS
jgi:hypothetical protein